MFYKSCIKHGANLTDQSLLKKTRKLAQGRMKKQKILFCATTVKNAFITSLSKFSPKHLFGKAKRSLDRKLREWIKFFKT